MNRCVHPADTYVVADSARVPRREWRAELALRYQHRGSRTIVSDARHFGPLRVQRAFYPEADGTCHSYLLHPPGGMAVGDQLAIQVRAEAQSRVLLTTPSAGKMYGTMGIANAEQMPQQQTVLLHADEGASLEWLPQETIVFNAAQARLQTRIYLHPRANCIAWDILRLGRAASRDPFLEGRCRQHIALYRDNQLVFNELTHLDAGTPLQTAAWGLQGRNTLATLLVTGIFYRDEIDALMEYLQTQCSAEGLWGLTQKNDVLIARYLGNSIMQCRAGLRFLWQAARRRLFEKEAIAPRIWLT